MHTGRKHKRWLVRSKVIIWSRLCSHTADHTDMNKAVFTTRMSLMSTAYMQSYWSSTNFHMRNWNLIDWGNHLQMYILLSVSHVNSLGPGDAIWQHRTRSGLAQVMACCLTTPSNYLNQCWLIIHEVPWHSSGYIIIRRSEEINQLNKIDNCSF